MLGLDQVWWMVSPQNPLKSAQDMAGFEARMEGARRIADHPDIEVSDIEAGLGTRYTVDTLEALIARLPKVRFVWLMGADNLVQLPQWRDWEGIFALVPIAVFDRNSYDFSAMEGEAAQRFAEARIPEDQASGLADREPPAWVYLHTPQHSASASAIRHNRDD